MGEEHCARMTAVLPVLVLGGSDRRPGGEDRFSQQARVRHSAGRGRALAAWVRQVGRVWLAWPLETRPV